MRKNGQDKPGRRTGYGKRSRFAASITLRLELLEQRVLLAATSPDTFIVQPNTLSYDAGAIFYSQPLQSPTEVAPSGEPLVDLRVDTPADDAFALTRDETRVYDFDPSQERFVSSEVIQVDSDRTYRLDATTIDSLYDAEFELQYAAFDSDGLRIVPIHVNKFAGSTDTTLLATINPGDNSILVANATGWSNADGSPAESRVLAWFGYTSADGTTHDDYSYTRNVLGNATSAAWQTGAIVPDAASGGHRFTLSEPWVGAAVPPGTAVRNAIGDVGLLRLSVNKYDNAKITQFAPRYFSAFEAIQVHSSFGGAPWDANLTQQFALPAAAARIQFVSTTEMTEAVVRISGDETVGTAYVATFDGDTRAVNASSLGFIRSDTPVAVDPSRSYQVEVNASVHLAPGSTTVVETHSIGFVAEDVDGQVILPEHVSRYATATDTTLASDLAPGDLRIVLSNGRGWNNIDVDPKLRSFAWYGYTDSQGNVYDDFTYTRNVKVDPVRGIWPVNGVSGDTITLTAPWDGPALPAGTAVRNAIAGDAVIPALLDDGPLTTAGERLSAAISGQWIDGIPQANAFPPGTAAIRAAAELNRSTLARNDIVVLGSFAISQGDPWSVVANPSTHSYELELDVLANDSVAAGSVQVTVATAEIGSVTIVDDKLDYTAPSWFVGTDVLTYTVQHTATNETHTETARVSILGTGADKDAVLIQQLSQNETNRAVAVDPLGNDDGLYQSDYRVVSGQTLHADGIANPHLFANDGKRFTQREDPAAAALVKGPTHGSLTLYLDSTFQYTSDDGFAGTDTFIYSIFDGLRTDTAQVTIHVAAAAGDFVDRNLSKLAIAAHDYHGVFKKLPPIYAGRDENGLPYLSWRVHLLPYLGHYELYQQFALTEPWDSATNLPLASQMPDVFGDGTGTETTSTRIQTIVSPQETYHEVYGQMGFASDRESAFRSILDGFSNTLLYVQVGADRAVPWTSPQDADFDFLDPLNTLGTIESSGVPVVFVDKTTEVLPATIDVDTFSAFASRNAGTLLGIDRHTYFRQLASDAGGQTAIDAYDTDGSRQDQYIADIAVGLQHYVSTYRAFPPAFNGPQTSGLSWRVHLLGFLGTGDLYRRFNVDESWDSPTNLALLDEMPDVYRSFGDSPDSNTTRIKKIVGPGAAWQIDNLGNEQSPRPQDFVDGEANTLVVVEAGPSEAVLWTKPDEFEFDPANPLVAMGDITEFFRAILADGSTIKLPADIDAETFLALVTRDAGATYLPEDPPQSELFDVDSLRRKLGVAGDAALIETLNAADSTARLEHVAFEYYQYASEKKFFPIDRTDPSHFDADGKPFLSWRVHLLPFLGHTTLYEQFHLDEPWDSANNLPLLQFMPDVFRDNDDAFDSTVTRLQRFVDNGALHDSDSTTGFRHVLDGQGNTIAFVQTGVDVAVPWTHPQDILFDPDNPLAGLGDVEGGFFAAMADYAVNYLRADDPGFFKRLVTRDGGENLANPTSRSEPIRSVVAEGQIGAIDVRLGPVGVYYAGPQSSPLHVVVADPSVVTVLVDTVVLEEDNDGGYYSLTFQGTDNAIVDGTRTTTISVGDEVFDVTVWDNDSYQMLVDDYEAVVDESGATSVRNAVLNAQPASDVIIALNSFDTHEVTVSPATITFTPDNWNQPQSFTLAGVGDAPLADGDTETTVRLSVKPFGSDPQFFLNHSSVDVNVTSLDKDDAQLVVDSDSLSINEGDSSPWLVSLTAEPTQTVYVDIAVSDPSQIGVSTQKIEFAPNNWNIPQAVTVTAVDDVVLDGNVTGQVTLAVTTFSGSAFSGADDRTVSVVAVDNEIANFTIDDRNGKTVAFEAGSETGVSVTLDVRPLAPVRINVSNEDPSEMTVSTDAIVLEPFNWFVPQYVDVAAVDDQVIDGTQQRNLTFSVDTSQSDIGFHDIAPQSVVVTTLDTTGNQIQTSLAQIEIREGDEAPSEFEVTLEKAPFTDITVHLSHNADQQLTIGPQVLVFTSENWQTPRTVTIEAIDDSQVEPTIIKSLTLWAEPTLFDPLVIDPVFAPRSETTEAHVDISVTDNDVAGLSHNVVEPLQLSEARGRATFEVSLTAQPLTPVTIEVDAGQDPGFIVANPQLVFTPSNWIYPKEVRLTGLLDFAVEPASQVAITLNILDDSDSHFRDIQATPILVDVIDHAVSTVLVNQNSFYIVAYDTDSDFSVAAGTSDLQERFVLNLGPRNETVRIELNEGDRPIEIHAGGGDDRFEITRFHDAVLDGGDGYDELVFVGRNAEFDAAGLADRALFGIEKIDFRGTGEQTVSVMAEDALRVFEGTTEVTFVHDSGDKLTWGLGWTALAPVFRDGAFQHQLASGDLIVNVASPKPWTNPLSRFDVDRSGHTSPLDILLVINQLASQRASSRLEPDYLLAMDGSQPIVNYVDVNRSGTLTPSDILGVINYLAAQSQQREDAASGEAISSGTAFEFLRRSGDSVEEEEQLDVDGSFDLRKPIGKVMGSGFTSAAASTEVSLPLDLAQVDQYHGSIEDIDSVHDALTAKLE